MTAAANRDIIQLLVDQHDQIKHLFGQLREAQGNQKQTLFEDLVRLLAVHEMLEEQVVHPRARVAINFGSQVVADRLEEENEAKHALTELYDLGVDRPEFDAKLAALADAVVAHATHEEADEFLALREALSIDELIDMTGALRIAEESAPATVAGPPIAIFGRLRDTLRDWRQSQRTSTH